MSLSYTLDNSRREYWIEQINSIRTQILRFSLDRIVELNFCNIKKEEFTPVHIVLLACLCEHLYRLKFNIRVNASAEIVDFLKEELKFHLYFDNSSNEHIESENSSILNLWKVVKNRAQGYSISVTTFFRRTCFDGYDLTGLQTSLDEIYNNIADHSESNGNAFSYISYEEEKHMIHVAACDFGVGIPFTLKRAGYNYENGAEAIRQSLEVGVSAKSQTHNKGFGLDNVTSNLSEGGMLRMVSNSGVVFCTNAKNNVKQYLIDYNFQGTLVFFDICIDTFEEMLDDIMI